MFDDTHTMDLIEQYEELYTQLKASKWKNVAIQEAHSAVEAELLERAEHGDRAAEQWMA